MKKEKYIEIENLTVSENLYSFVSKNLLPGIGISNSDFWNGFSKNIHELTSKNKELLEKREDLQKKIDDFHKKRKGNEYNFKEYNKFLNDIGYLKKVGPDFRIKTKNVDIEIAKICGPQLVVPIMNARYALNATNARWVSLYDSLYGTDIISETRGAVRGKTYNPIRGKKVIDYARNLLDKYVPLKKGTWKDISEIPQVNNNKLNLKLKNPKQFVGYVKKSNNLSSLLLINNNLHIDIIFDLDGTLEINNPEGNQDKAAIHDIFLESAISTICDHEDSVAAVDAEDKVLGYKNWLGLILACVSPEIIENTIDEIKQLNIPFGFKANLWKTEEPVPVHKFASPTDEIGANPTKTMGTRDDYTDVMFLEFAKKMMSKGATILGGCCETKPAHIKKISILKN